MGFKKKVPLHLFYFDQDCLNAALTVLLTPLSLLDRFAIGLQCCGGVLCHVIDSPKPRKISRLWHRLRKRRSIRYHELYWRNCYLSVPMRLEAGEVSIPESLDATTIFDRNG